MRIIDIHAHILPGVDDGAKDWDTCIEMLSESAKSGVTTIIATPHYAPWKKNPAPEKIKNLCAEARKKFYQKQGIAMDIYSGNEIYYDVDITQDLKTGKILTLAGSRYVLVEFNHRSPYQIFCRAVKDFTDAGYIPIIAHMERYECLGSRRRIQELREMGARFQMNVGAFRGSIFDENCRWAKKRLKGEDVDFLASDMHDVHKRTPITDEKLQWIQKNLDSKYLRKLLYANAQQILESIEE